MANSIKRYLIGFSFILIGINIGLFIWINIMPIDWTNTELFTQGYLWSINDMDDFRLREGLSFKDFLKPFNVYRIDGFLRLRQFSSLIEMLSFKFWQYWAWGEVLFRNYTVSILHFVNVLVLGRIVYQLTKNRNVALVTALLFLNCGVAVATIVYPFRLAKIVVITLFLFQFLIVVSTEKDFFRSGWRSVSGFWTLVFLSVFSDETALFTTLFLLGYIAFRDGVAEFWCRRVMMAVLITGGTIALFAFYSTGLAYDFPGVQLKASETLGYFQNLGAYFLNSQTYIDLMNAFFNYFLRRNFGYWDKSFVGVVGALASAIVFLTLFKSRLNKEHKGIVAILAFCVVLKVCIMPHMKVHPFIMPEGTFFPSLLFFSYYYVYLEALFLIIIVGLFLAGKENQSEWKNLLLISMVTLISFSNVIHLKDGPKNALAISRFDQPYRRGVVTDIQLLTEVIKNTSLGSIYLSFHGHDQKQLKGILYNGVKMSLYEYIIPIKFLRPLQEGKIVMSYDNIVSKLPSLATGDLSQASVFYDVNERRLFDLNRFRDRFGVESLQTKTIKEGSEQTVLDVTLTDDIKHLVFFIKGSAAYSLSADQSVLMNRDQSYLGSFERFQINFNPKNGKYPSSLSLSIVPQDESGSIDFVGPFLFFEKAEYELKMDDFIAKSSIKNNSPRD